MSTLERSEENAGRFDLETKKAKSSTPKTVICFVIKQQQVQQVATDIKIEAGYDLVFFLH